jgi:protease-4
LSTAAGKGSFPLNQKLVRRVPIMRPISALLCCSVCLLFIPAASHAFPGPAGAFGWAAYPEAGQGFYVNPAAFSYLNGFRLRLGVGANSREIQRLDMVGFSLRDAGFTFWNGGSLRRYSAALSHRPLGGPFAAGFSWSWIDSDDGPDPWDGRDIFTAGVIARPVPWLGAGAFYTAVPEVPGRESDDVAGAGLALRPWGDRHLTLTADMRTDPGFDDVDFSAGLETVPLPGLLLKGEYTDDGFSLGLGVELGQGAFSSSGSFSDDADFSSGRGEVLITSSRLDNVFGEGRRFVSVETGTAGELPQRPFLGPRERSFTEQMLLVRRLAGDPTVEGILVDTGHGVGNPAQAEELRSCLEDFAATGRPVYVTVGNGGNGTCYVASAGRVLIHPAGEMALTGFASTAFFARDLLDRLGVYPDLLHIGEFKSASDMLTRSDMSGAQRLATTELLESMQEELLEKVSSGRGYSQDLMEGILRDGLYTSHRAVEVGLADEVAMPDEAEEIIERDLGRGVRVVPLDCYAATIPENRPWEPEPHVAVVVASGYITTGESGEAFPIGRTVGSESMAGLIRKAASVPGVRALVLRIDSGGGDAMASYDIHSAVSRCSEVMPVVVSMGGVAASGGYHIACPADVVFADEMTVTGSIGIISGKFSFGGLMEKFGVNTEQVSVSPSGGIGSPWRPYTDRERERVFLMMSDGYDLFVKAVAESRGMTWEEVDAIGRGRVWSGADALEIGLVDSIGGVADAIECAALLGGMEDGEPPVRVYPEPSPFGSFDMGLPLLGSGSLDALEILLSDGRLLFLAPVMHIE